MTDPPWMKLVGWPAALVYFGRAAGKEVGFSMVRKSPSFSWIRGTSITPSGAKGGNAPEHVS